MAKQPPQVNYEVYYLQDGRWTLQSRFDHREKHLAVKEGKELSKLGHLSAVKVIKEKYDRQTGESSETTVFRYSKGQIELADPKKGRGVVIPEKQKSNVARGVVLPGGGKSDPMVNGKVGGAGSKAKTDQEVWEESSKKPSIGLVPKIILIVLMSVVLAALFTGFGSMVLTKFPMFSGIMKQETAGSVLIGLFVVGFLLSCATMIYSFVTKEDMRRTAEEPAPSRKSVADGMPSPETTPSGVLSDEEKKKSEAQEENPDAPPSDQVSQLSNGTLPQGVNQNGAINQSYTAGSSGGLGAVGGAGQAVNHKQNLMNFLSTGIDRLKNEKIPLEKFNKFGICLFLAGAAEVVKERNNLSHLGFTSLLRDLVTVLGTSKGMAETFAEKYDTYLVEDSRYMEIFRSGRQAMIDKIEVQAPPGDRLLAAIERWNRPKDDQGGKEPITVVFTDIVGSTNMTQTLGDQGAQTVVRTHNTIVREALSLHSGKEIKHTGDGIMASFASGSEAIRATIDIQKDILEHIKEDPEFPLKVRIGLNTGELIMEENDLFGTTVQLSARICDKADAGEIFVSGATKAICQGSNEFFFTEHGEVELKGFKEPISLFKVIWKEDEVEAHKAELAAAGQQTEQPDEASQDAPEGQDAEAAETAQSDTGDQSEERSESETESGDKTEEESPKEIGDTNDTGEPDDGSEELFDEEPEFDLPPFKAPPSPTSES